MSKNDKRPGFDPVVHSNEEGATTAKLYRKGRPVAEVAERGTSVSFAALFEGLNAIEDELDDEQPEGGGGTEGGAA